MEWSQIQQQVYENIKLGTETLKSFNEQLTAEDIEEILLDTEEALAQQKV
jgi:hypothetical protein